MHPATASITTPSLGSSRASYTVQMVRRKKDDIAGVVKALLVISRAGQGSHWESKACTLGLSWSSGQCWGLRLELSKPGIWSGYSQQGKKQKKKNSNRERKDDLVGFRAESIMSGGDFTEEEWGAIGLKDPG